MRTHVLFFGILKDLAGRGSDSPELPEGATVADLTAHYAKQIPQLKKHLEAAATAVNQEYVHSTEVLQEGDEVALLPPVSGGSGAPRPESKGRVAIVRHAIDTGLELSSLKCGDDGAAVVFEGVVRNQTRGRGTLYLEYEAYEEMALRQMKSLVRQAAEQFQIRDVSLIHRLGRLQIGETSVLIVVASAHRAAAFDACRWLIDTLKRTVPIWKKEYFEDGAVWADGEPFPLDLAK
jgi:molybdopterin synthase catalytic subunit